MRCVIETSCVERLNDLPPAAFALFAAPGAGPGIAAFYDSLAWYRLLVEAATPPQLRCGFLLASRDAQILAVLPLHIAADGALMAMTSPYTCLQRVLIAPNLDDVTVQAIGAAFARHARRHGSGLLLDSLDADDPALAKLCHGLARGGLVVLGFPHFGNWHAVLPQPGWAAYLASRDGALRETIRRRRAKLARDPAFRFEMISGGAALEPGIAAFEAVYAKSWKDPEPFATFNAEMMRMSAGLGMLRLAVLWHGTQPVAVQYWLVANRCAQVLKLAHDGGFDAFSPGTVLTAWAISHLLDHDGVIELDFGRGDDGYKRLWTDTRRQRVGVMAANPRRLRGGLAILRHVAGRAAERVRRALHRLRS